MSWQDVDTNLVGTGQVSKAAIVGLQGGVWAISAGFSLSPAEEQAVTHAFDDLSATQASGIHLAGEKYITVNATDDVIVGKKGADGVVLVKTKQAILVSVNVSPVQISQSRVTTEGLADYLKGVGY